MIEMFYDGGEEEVREEIKKELQDNLDYLHTIPVTEYTLYRKGIDINIQKGISKNSNLINHIKKNLGYPINNDYETLEPEVIFVETAEDQLIGRILRTFISSAVGKQSPGRLLKFYVRDKISKKYLGIISFGSDFIGIGGRDKIIGGTTDQKLKDGMLKYTMMGSTIVPTQPLGYNFLGGKLISLLCASDVVENAFNNKYKEILTGITTTSLYGGYSQYTRLNYWKKCKSSNGTIKIEPTEDVYIKAKEGYKLIHPKTYKENIIKSHPKSRILQLIYKELEIKTYENNAPRGVYGCPLYENSNEFLRMEDKKLGKKKFDNSVDSLTELWKKKYAQKRIIKQPILTNPLFYDDLINVKWETVKSKYLQDVGR